MSRFFVGIFAAIILSGGALGQASQPADADAAAAERYRTLWLKADTERKSLRAELDEIKAKTKLAADQSAEIKFLREEIGRLEEAVRILKKKLHEPEETPAAPQPSARTQDEVKNPSRTSAHMVGGIVKIEIAGGRIGQLAILAGEVEAPSAGDYLVLPVKITNTSDSKKVSYRTWRGRDKEDFASWTELTDDLGNNYLPLCQKTYAPSAQRRNMVSSRSIPENR